MSNQKHQLDLLRERLKYTGETVLIKRRNCAQNLLHTRAKAAYSYDSVFLQWCENQHQRKRKKGLPVRLAWRVESRPMGTANQGILRVRCTGDDETRWQAQRVSLNV